MRYTAGFVSTPIAPAPALPPCHTRSFVAELAVVDASRPCPGAKKKCLADVWIGPASDSADGTASVAQRVSAATISSNVRVKGDLQSIGRIRPAVPAVGGL